MEGAGRLRSGRIYQSLFVDTSLTKRAASKAELDKRVGDLAVRSSRLQPSINKPENDCLFKRSFSVASQISSDIDKIAEDADDECPTEVMDDPLEGAQEKENNNPLTRVQFDSKITRKIYFTQTGMSEETQYCIEDLYEGEKKTVRRIASDEKPTQNRNHFLEEIKKIRMFFQEKIAPEKQDEKEVQDQLNKTIAMLEDRGNNVKNLTALLDNNEDVWLLFCQDVSEQVKGSPMEVPVAALFLTEPGQQLLQLLLEKAYRYHFSSREDFKKEFHVQEL